MKKGEIYEGVIGRVSFPDKGYVEVQGEERKIIVKHGIPGQRVQVRIKKVKQGKCEGEILETIQKAETEVAAYCSHFGECGGCTYQTLPYEEQLLLKEEQEKELLLREDAFPQNWEGIVPSPSQFAYRNKMEFTFGDACKDGPLTLGLHKRGAFYDIVPVVQCRIVEEDVLKILRETLAYWQEMGVSYYHRMRHTGFLRHLLVRKGFHTGELLVDLVTTGLEETSKLLQGERDMFVREWTRRILALPLDGKIVGVLHTCNDSVADVIIDETTRVLYGQDFFYEELLGLRFQITPFSFFQTNSGGAEVLYQKVREYAGERKEQVIYDLYSGTGTIAQLLAAVAKKVVGVELVAEAVEAARRNARENQLENCEFLAGDVLKVLDDLANRNQRPDMIVLDPPREGVHPKALAKIIEFGVEQMIYVSCKPTSLVRDLQRLCEAGYQVIKGCAVDMFPGTCHVETVVLMSKEGNDEI